MRLLFATLALAGPLRAACVPAAAQRPAIDPTPVPVTAAVIDDRYPLLRVPETYATARAWRPVGGLAERAGRYLGTNPTRWARVWCGRFLRMIVPRDPGPAFNVARNWSRYGHDAGGPRPGAIGVLARKGGGHVGIVLGRCADGAILLRSGNHRGRVGDGCYAPSRFIAFRA